MSSRQLYLQDPITKRIRFTKTGVERLKVKFARAGFDINQIKTMDEFERAVDASFQHQMRKLASTTSGQDIELDRCLEGLPGWD